MGPGPAVLQATSFTLELGTAATDITIPSGEEKRIRGKGKKKTKQLWGNQSEKRKEAAKREKRDVGGATGWGCNKTKKEHMQREREGERERKERQERGPS